MTESNSWSSTPTPPDTTLLWGHSALTLVLDVAPGRPVGVRRLAGAGPRPEPGSEPEPEPEPAGRAGQPLVEVLTAGAGRGRASHRFSETAVGQRLAYAGSDRRRDGAWHELAVMLRDEVTGLAAEVTFRSADGVGACQVRTRVTNQGREPVLLLGVTSFAAGFPGSPVERLDLVRGESEWLGEGRWIRQRLRDGAAVDLNLPRHGQDGKGRFAVVSQGAWSTEHTCRPAG